MLYLSLSPLTASLVTWVLFAVLLHSSFLLVISLLS